MKFFLIAGERSGDLHGARLISSLSELFPTARFVGYGGDAMLGAGMDLLVHYKEISYMGFWEVLKNLKDIRSQMKACKQSMAATKPDLLILIDFPGFNLRMASFAKNHNLPVAYYIAPKVWAWKESRISQIKQFVDQLYCILPFEKEYFKRKGLDVSYVGNPVLDAVDEHEGKLQLNSDVRRIACLPGSRMQEVVSSLGVIGDVARKRQDWYFLIAAVDNLPPSAYADIDSIPNVEVLWDRTYDILASVDAAIVVSGTATLETALFGVPQVVCYRTSWITYAIAKSLVKINFISLVNLIADREVVKEFIQADFNGDALLEELERLLRDDVKAQIRSDYEEIRRKIGTTSAAEKTAMLIKQDFSLD